MSPFLSSPLRSLHSPHPTITIFSHSDGVCLLFVAPILSAFETIDEIEDTTPSTASRAESGPLLPTAGNFKLKRTDAIWYMLSLACSANIGSALTYTGNPQNMIVASDSIEVLPPWKFLLFMILPVTFSWLLSTYYLQYCWICQREAQELEKRDQGIYLSQFCPGFKILTRYPASSSMNTASNKLSLGDLSDDEEAAYSQVAGTGSRTRPRSNSQGSGSGTPRSRKSSKSASTTKKPISTAFICGAETAPLPDILSPSKPPTRRSLSTKPASMVGLAGLADLEVCALSMSACMSLCVSLYFHTHTNPSLLPPILSPYHCRTSQSMTTQLCRRLARLSLLRTPTCSSSLSPS